MYARYFAHHYYGSLVWSTQVCTEECSGKKIGHFIHQTNGVTTFDYHRHHQFSVEIDSNPIKRKNTRQEPAVQPSAIARHQPIIQPHLDIIRFVI